MNKPGYCSTDELWQVNEKHLSRFIDKNVLPFLDIKPGAECLDIGEKNPKMEYIKKKTGLNIDQFYGYDFNEMIPWIGLYDIVFVFDIIEHLQNSLRFMEWLKFQIYDSGSIYLMYPTNPRWLWVEGHYNEIPPKHLDKWIIKPLGLKIVRQKSFVFCNDWRGLFIGIRPLIRIIKGRKSWKSLIRAVYYKWTIYEIKKADL